LAELFEHMAERYCGTLTMETGHLTTQEEVDWISQSFEKLKDLEPMTLRKILRTLIEADQFERYLASKFPATKRFVQRSLRSFHSACLPRFGLEGCEVVLPAIKDVIEQCSLDGVEKVEIGMAHRGRLNVLCNVLRKPFGALCYGLAGTRSDINVGDVLYHMGQTGTLTCLGDDGSMKPIWLSVASNPSHLEFINPVILGLVRAEQKIVGDSERKKIMALLVHGDASMSGLGIVTESLQLSGLEGYTTGGVIHIVINNQVVLVQTLIDINMAQIGFTTLPKHGRSGMHATDVVKMIGAPILHANADHPESVYKACLLATEWRSKFGKDVVIDIVGYRRHGHNEKDNPETFFPLTYEKIRKHPRVETIFSEKLIVKVPLVGWNRGGNVEGRSGIQGRGGEVDSGQERVLRSRVAAIRGRKVPAVGSGIPLL